MAYSLGFGSYVISLCLLVAVFIQHGGCSGKVMIHLKTYHILNGLLDSNNQCCDGRVASTSLCEPCDPFIVACLLNVRDHGQGSCVSANLSTVPVNNTNDIDFEATPVLVANYFTLNFTIPSRNLLIRFSMYDDDTYDVPPSEPDLLEDNGYTIYTLVPLKFTDVPIYRNGSLPTNKTNLEFDYYLQCDQDFYGYCDKYCHPDPDKYSCDSSGSRVCNRGWIGQNCTTFDYCMNITCLNGGSCSNELNTFKCLCTKNFTGALCENSVTYGFSTTQRSTLPSPQTSRSPAPQISTLTPKNVSASTSSLSPANSTGTPQLRQSKEEEKGDNTGAIVGAVIGALVALGLVAAGVIYYIKSQRLKKENVSAIR